VDDDTVLVSLPLVSVVVDDALLLSTGCADKRFCVALDSFTRLALAALFPAVADVICDDAKKRGANSGNHDISITVTSRIYCFAVNTYYNTHNIISNAHINWRDRSFTSSLYNTQSGLRPCNTDEGCK
jgi:hypothetical protein